MSYLQFDKASLVNLEYSLGKEILRSNRAGSFACTTIVGCNTRKYHGLLICPMPSLDEENHILLSALDTSIIQHESEFNLGIHKYPGDLYEPKGHKYIRDFEAEVVPKITCRVGGVILTQERLLVEREEQILIKYTLHESHTPTKMRFKPYLAFRNIHKLSKANMYADTHFKAIENGIKIRLYQGYPYLHIQFSKKVEYIHVPDWYYNIEYIREQERGYDYSEDLIVPGYFELPIKNGESIIFSASTKKSIPATFKKKFSTEISKRIPRDSFRNCLINSAQQFIIHKDKKTEVIAGFPWFGPWGRDTFISLPGLTLAIDDAKTCKNVIDTMVGRMKGGLFPNMGSDDNPAFNSVDAPLWFFWSLQQYANYINNKEEVWKKYGNPIKAILKGFKNGLPYNIKMHDNGLIFAGEKGTALTWMDAMIEGKAVTPRTGYAVEINALWYNALCFCLDLAKTANDTKFINAWNGMPEKIKDSFTSTFWDDKKKYLADVVDNDEKDFSVRPNMVFATCFEYSPLNDEMKKSVLDIVERDLLTPKGLRTLSPKNEMYEGIYEGAQEQRDKAYHQGTVWPWLLEFFCEGYMKLYKNAGLCLLNQIYEGFEEDNSNHGIGSISEIYDGNPPHKPKGAISQAWSVAALLQIGKLIEKYS